MAVRRQFAVVVVATLAVAGTLAGLAPAATGVTATAGAFDAADDGFATAEDPADIAVGQVRTEARATGFPPPTPPPERWNRTYGADGAEVAAVTTDEGAVVAAGTTLTASGSSYSGWLLATDGDGAVRLQESYGVAGEAHFRDVAVTDAGYLLAGTLEGGVTAGTDGWVLAVDHNGTVQWQQILGSVGDDALSAIEVTADGYHLAGTRGGASDADGWLVRIGTDGVVQWQRTYDSQVTDQVHDVTSHPSGGYVLAGETTAFEGAAADAWTVTVAPNGTELRQRTYGGPAADRFRAVETRGEDLLFAGESDTYGSGAQRGWLLQRGPDGTERWNETYDVGVTGDLAVTDDGVLLAGTASADAGDRNGVLVGVDTDGTTDWRRAYGGGGADAFADVLVGPGGGYLLAGDSDPPGTSGTGWLLALGEVVQSGPTSTTPQSTPTATTTPTPTPTATATSTPSPTTTSQPGSTTVSTTTTATPAQGSAAPTTLRTTRPTGAGGGGAAGARTTTTNASAASGADGSFPWPLVALLLIVVVLGGVLVAVRRQELADGAFGSDDGGEPDFTPPESDEPEFGPPEERADEPHAESPATAEESVSGPPTDPDPLGTNARSYTEVVRNSLTRLSRRAHTALPFLADPATAEGGAETADADGPSQSGDSAPGEADAETGSEPEPMATAGADAAAATDEPADTSQDDGGPADTAAEPPSAEAAAGSDGGSATMPEEGGTIPDASADAATETGVESTTGTDEGVFSDDGTSGGDGGQPAESDPTGMDENAQMETDEGGPTGTVGATDASATGGDTPDAAASAGVVATDETDGEPGTFTLRNPGDEPVVVAFRCQTATETLFNYYAELPPGAIKRARKLPAGAEFEITIAITDGPAQSRLFDNDGTDGQDVTVTVSPDTIEMEAVSFEEKTDAAILGTVEPEASGPEGDSAADSGASGPDTAGDAADAADGPAVSDDPGDVLPGPGDTDAEADGASEGGGSDDMTEPAVSDDPDDVLPGPDDGPEDSLPDTDDDASEQEPAETGADSPETTADSGAASTDDGGGGGGSFQDLKEEFESGDADWADEDESGDSATPDEETADATAGEDPPESSAGSGGGGGGGGGSFQDLKEEFESGDADWADENGDGSEEESDEEPLGGAGDGVDDLELGDQGDEEFDDDLGLGGEEFEDGLGLEDDDLDESGGEESADDLDADGDSDDLLDDDFDDDLDTDEDLGDDFDDSFGDDFDDDLDDDFDDSFGDDFEEDLNDDDEWGEPSGSDDGGSAEDSGADDSDGDDGGDSDKSFAELKEEYESGDADWVDE